MPDKIKDVYDLISDKGYFSDENEFRSFVSDPNKRKEAYALIADDGFFTDENEFNSFFTDVKKKGFSQELPPPPMPSGEKLPQGVGNGAKKPSPSKSQSISQTTISTTPKNPQSRIKLYSETATGIQNRIPKLVEAYNQAEANGDEQAMQELEAQINQDSQKIDYFNKAIEGQKQLAAIKEKDTISNSFNIGLYDAAGRMMQSPKAFDETIATLLADVAGIPQEAVQEYMKNIYPKTNSASDKIASAGKFVSDIAQERGETKNINRKYGASAFNALLKGDYSTSAEYAVKDFSQSLGTSATYLNPATAVLSSVGMVGDELQTAKDEGREVNSQVVLAGSVKAALEVVTERMFSDSSPFIASDTSTSASLPNCSIWADSTSATSGVAVSKAASNSSIWSFFSSIAATTSGGAFSPIALLASIKASDSSFIFSACASIASATTGLSASSACSCKL